MIDLRRVAAAVLLVGAPMMLAASCVVRPPAIINERHGQAFTAAPSQSRTGRPNRPSLKVEARPAHPRSQ